MRNNDKLSEEFIKAKAIANEISNAISQNKNLTDSELLTDFTENDPVADEVISSLTSEERHRGVADLLESLDKEKDIERLVYSLRGMPSTGRSRSKLTRVWAACAAVVAVAAGIWVTSDSSNTDTITYIIPADERKAVLTYSDGRSLVLDRENLVIGENGCPLIEDAETAGMPDAEVLLDQYTTLKVPRGGDFFITLPDGTQVWLNSDTEMRFPLRYAGNERRVYLKGEAFFDVAENPQKPFVVELGTGEISVLGTRFNVTNYDESPVSAVLVEGSIAFSSEMGESVTISPSQKVTCNRTTGKINITDVDPVLYTSWIDNVFIFRRQTLEDIIKRLAHWCDVDVVFEDENAKHILLSGQIRRDEDLEAMLRIYEKSADVMFKLKGKTLTISTK